MKVKKINSSKLFLMGFFSRKVNKQLKTTNIYLSLYLSEQQYLFLAQNMIVVLFLIGKEKLFPWKRDSTRVSAKSSSNHRSYSYV